MVTRPFVRKFERQLGPLPVRVAVQLLPGHPAQSYTRCWLALRRRAWSLAGHSMDRDALQVRFQHDVSGDRYAL
jgi:hypothetical protein